MPFNERHKQIAALWPKPRCCDLVQSFPYVYARATEAWEHDDDQEHDPIIAWRWAWLNDNALAVIAGYSIDSLESPPTPTHCPFCRKPLPRLRLRKDPPKPMCDSDGNYCHTCDERLDACMCFPTECLWEIDLHVTKAAPTKDHPEAVTCSNCDRTFTREHFIVGGYREDGTYNTDRVDPTPGDPCPVCHPG
jgi:hypothetical protein